jgi:hypothetical protein
MIVKESYTLDTSDPNIIHIHHVQVEHNGVNMGGPMWFERKNLPWVVQNLQACLTTYAFPEASLQSGPDDLKVLESGPEQAPIINLLNRRDKDAAHGGVYALLLSKPIAEKLVKELAAIK